MLIVGSKALSFNFSSLNRQYKDIDIIGSIEESEDLICKLQPKEIKRNDYIHTLIGIKNKSEIFNTDNVEVLLSDNSVSLKKYLELSNELYATPEILFSLKKSHINFPIKFDKHIVDYAFLFEYFKGEDKLDEITKINFKECEDRLGKLKTPSLNKTVKSFFRQSNGYVKSFFIHDHIHQVMAHYDRPMYEKMQRDLLIAKCDKNLWNDFTFEEKCKCVLEESYSISLERKIIPMLFDSGSFISADKAFNWALMRVCTTLCSGWFRKFATDNYFKIKQYYNPEYVEKFLEAYESGKIKKLES